MLWLCLGVSGLRLSDGIGTSGLRWFGLWRSGLGLRICSFGLLWTVGQAVCDQGPPVWTSMSSLSLDARSEEVGPEVDMSGLRL